VYTEVVGTWEARSNTPVGHRSGPRSRDNRRLGSIARVADRGIVLLMTAKETSRSEGRPRQVGNSADQQQIRTQSRSYLPVNLIRVNEAATRSRQLRFTALLHHVNTAALDRAFWRLRRQAAPGIDGMTLSVYAQDLALRLQDLCARVHTGRYRPKPVRRVFIEKADGGQRPLGILVLEDKIVQSAVAEVLSAVYEADFLDCSYGFRPGRSAHQALRTVHEAIMSERVNWVFDADIRKFFDSVDHDWLMRMVEHRIADPRVLRLIRQWLEVGVMEDGRYNETVEGTPQGAGISPLLANIFLHYVLDLWVRQWSRRQARGRLRLVRFADDFLITLEHLSDAERLRDDLIVRMQKFNLQLHEGKTHLIEFGRYAPERRRRRGAGRPEVFHFLGFTHYCGTTRAGRFMVQRCTQRQRITRKLRALRWEMRRRLHQTVSPAACLAACRFAWLRCLLRHHGKCASARAVPLSGAARVVPQSPTS